MFRLLLVNFLTISSVLSACVEFRCPPEFNTVQAWEEIVKDRPDNPAYWHGLTPVPAELLQNTLESYNATIETNYAQFLTLDRVGYGQAWHLPEHSKILTVGDIHGSFMSLLRLMRRWVLEGKMSEEFMLAPGYFLVCIGDYVDRNLYSTECLFLLVMIALKNYGKVALLRGNHEAIEINMDFMNYGIYAFYKELEIKYRSSLQDIFVVLKKFYDLLPLTHYVVCGDTRLQFVHAGIEPKFSPKALLLREVPVVSIHKNHLQRPLDHARFSNYLWMDVLHLDTERRGLLENDNGCMLIEESLASRLFSASSRGSGVFCADVFAVRRILEMQLVHALIRGHQDSIAVLALSKNRYIAGGKDDPNTPIDWKELVPDQNPTILMHQHEPIFTTSTSTAQSKLDSEGYIEIILKSRYTECVMKVAEYPLPQVDRSRVVLVWHPSGKLWPEDSLVIQSKQSDPDLDRPDTPFVGENDDDQEMWNQLRSRGPKREAPSFTGVSGN